MQRLLLGAVIIGLLLAPSSLTARTDFVGTLTHAAVSVLTTSTSVLAATTAKRLLLILVNDGANTIYCNLAGAAAVLNEGVRLNASGGNLLLDASVGITEIFCIAETGTTVLLVTQGV